jgi:hypothetical protein
MFSYAHLKLTPCSFSLGTPHRAECAKCRISKVRSANPINAKPDHPLFPSKRLPNVSQRLDCHYGKAKLGERIQNACEAIAPRPKADPLLDAALVLFSPCIYCRWQVSLQVCPQATVCRHSNTTSPESNFTFRTAVRTRLTRVLWGKCL